MKKIALLSLVFVMLLSLFACGQTNDADVPSATESKAEATESQAEATVNKFEQFEHELRAKAIKFEKTDKAAALVGTYSLNIPKRLSSTHIGARTSGFSRLGMRSNKLS